MHDAGIANCNNTHSYIVLLILISKPTLLFPRPLHNNNIPVKWHLTWFSSKHSAFKCLRAIEQLPTVITNQNCISMITFITIAITLYTRLHFYKLASKHTPTLQRLRWLEYHVHIFLYIFVLFVFRIVIYILCVVITQFHLFHFSSWTKLNFWNVLLLLYYYNNPKNKNFFSLHFMTSLLISFLTFFLSLIYKVNSTWV